MVRELKFKMPIALMTSSLLMLPLDGIASEAIESEIDLSFRYRVELVSQDGIAEDAEASTLRTRATIKTKWRPKLDSVIEFDDVTEIGMDDFNSGQGTSPTRGQFPVVADPEGTEVNQAYIRYSGDSAKFALGRQRILIGNQRFVGGVGWRQNEQTYDSFTVNSGAGEFKYSYAYVYNVNRIFGESVPAGDHQHNTHLVNVDYKIGKGKFSGYYFAIDNEDAVGLSNNTFGIRYQGKAGDFGYIFEYASQSDAGDNPNDYKANYYHIDGNYNTGNFSVGAGIEVLGGDQTGGQGFTTSLATLHKFQGWADVFLGTPTAGIEDFYIKGGFKLAGADIKLFYHDFSTDEGGVDLGSEFDLVVTKKFNKHWAGLFKLADFSSDNASYASRDKMWFMLTYQL
ncbi:hypothetical protein FLL45_06205 [Aliikangiella marina]|uniref:Alginate export domain-containing protein n=1 Tax=Aliikangiella marina TaxID=1712262 RepID=A0A545TJY1_9GAMM|nr:alginate export family protein [Aliikangiella marina]TQV77533.1 hypothetical protein FLL45_06205 [Aliikangiella marina]